MSRPLRKSVALLLLGVAVVLLVLEPFPKGVAVGITETHGIESGDIPAIVLLLAAAWLAFGDRLRSRRQRLDHRRRR